VVAEVEPADVAVPPDPQVRSDVSTASCADALDDQQRIGQGSLRGGLAGTGEVGAASRLRSDVLPPRSMSTTRGPSSGTA
jgi:hypothetical protein